MFESNTLTVTTAVCVDKSSLLTVAVNGIAPRCCALRTWFARAVSPLGLAETVLRTPFGLVYE